LGNEELLFLNYYGGNTYDRCRSHCMCPPLALRLAQHA